jgi:hypothetical protein
MTARHRDICLESGLSIAEYVPEEEAKELASHAGIMMWSGKKRKEMDVSPKLSLSWIFLYLTGDIESSGSDCTLAEFSPQLYLGRLLEKPEALVLGREVYTRLRVDGGQGHFHPVICGTTQAAAKQHSRYSQKKIVSILRMNDVKFMSGL